MNILLVEDDIMLSNTISKYLRMHNYSVKVVHDGLQAIDEAINSNKYDLFILDMNLPGASGIEILEEIRNKTSKTPVIMMSAYCGADIMEQAKSLGCSAFMRKPFGLEELGDKIKEVTAKKISGDMGFKR
jgi:DNA-binding response OmpR family regulator